MKAVVDAWRRSRAVETGGGSQSLQVKPRVAWDKGKALSYSVAARFGGEHDAGEVLSLYFGDDHTDEDVSRA